MPCAIMTKPILKAVSALLALCRHADTDKTYHPPGHHLKSIDISASRPIDRRSFDWAANPILFSFYRRNRRTEA